jgi:hypothetical protein
MVGRMMHNPKVLGASILDAAQARFLGQIRSASPRRERIRKGIARIDGARMANIQEV